MGDDLGTLRAERKDWCEWNRKQKGGKTSRGCCAPLDCRKYLRLRRRPFFPGREGEVVVVTS